MNFPATETQGSKTTSTPQLPGHEQRRVSSTKRGSHSHRQPWRGKTYHTRSRHYALTKLSNSRIFLLKTTISRKKALQISSKTSTFAFNQLAMTENGKSFNHKSIRSPLSTKQKTK